MYGKSSSFRSALRGLSTKRSSGSPVRHSPRSPQWESGITVLFLFSRPACDEAPSFMQQACDSTPGFDGVDAHRLDPAHD
jgi:hypothetical protein